MDYQTSLAYLNSMYFEYVTDPTLIKLIGRVLKDTDFLEGTAASSHHHVGKGQLVVHTAEVVAFVVKFITGHNGYSSGGKEKWELTPQEIEQLVAAAYLHDYMKSIAYDKEEYKTKPGQYKYIKNDQEKQIGHIVEVLCWIRTSTSNHYPILEHCILAHHGRLQWGSPVEPQTLCAWLLHTADMASAYFSDGN